MGIKIKVSAASIYSTVRSTKLADTYTWKKLYKRLSKPFKTIGVKKKKHPEQWQKEKEDCSYYIRGYSKLGIRADEYLDECYLLNIDGDKGLSGSKLESIESAAKKLKASGIAFIIHTTSTPGRWRLIVPFQKYKKEDAGILTKYLYHWCLRLDISVDWPGESAVKSQAMFFGQNTIGNKYKSFGNIKGKVWNPDFLSKKKRKKIRKGISVDNYAGSGLSGDDHNPTDTFIKQLQSGTIHQAAKVYAGWLRLTTDLSTSQIIQQLTAMIKANCSDPGKVERWMERKGEGLEEWFHQEIGEPIPENEYGDSGIGQDPEGLFTVYPNQGGKMGKLVKAFLNMHHFKIPELAVAQAHALIASLGGRVYTLESGSGIAWTALIVGRTGIGKSFLLNNLTSVIGSLHNRANQFDGFRCIGSSFYISAKNFVEDVVNSGTLLSIRTESGQQDRSKAGDMARVRMMELEFATQSGRAGFVSPGGQNDKIPALYSPAVTVIRETVLESTIDGDTERMVDVAGDSGRRSHIVLNSIKPKRNKNVKYDLDSKKLAEPLEYIYGLASNEDHRNAKVPLNKWIEIRYENMDTVDRLADEWVKKENEAVREQDTKGIAFYSRLHQKVPAWAARLAILEDPEHPVITDKMLEIAIKSLEAEHEIFSSVVEDLKGDWETLVDLALHCLRSGGTLAYLIDDTDIRRVKHWNKLAKKGIVRWNKIVSRLKKSASYKKLAKDRMFNKEMFDRLAMEGISVVPQERAWGKYGTKAKLIQLLED